jgi:alkylhydroperoxidase family enzyme
MSSAPRTTIGLADAAPDLARAIGDFQRVAYPGRIDLVTRELVRIASGRLSHCRICRNLRLTAAIDRGFDEGMVAQLDDVDSSDLSPARKAAVKLTHAFLIHPQGLSPADTEALTANFDPEQRAELLLDLIRYRPGSKLTVAGGTEPVEEALVVV